MEPGEQLSHGLDLFGANEHFLELIELGVNIERGAVMLIYVCRQVVYISSVLFQSEVSLG